MTGEKDGREPLINVYKCEYNCLTVTVDVDEGVTPFMISCRSRSRPDRPLKPELTGADGFCIGTANSSFYPRGPKPPWISEPKWEWYLPNETELEAECAAEPESRNSIIAHVKNGGLMLRPRTNREPIYHKEKP